MSASEPAQAQQPYPKGTGKDFGSQAKGADKGKGKDSYAAFVYDKGKGKGKDVYGKGKDFHGKGKASGFDFANLYGQDLSDITILHANSKCWVSARRAWVGF